MTLYDLISMLVEEVDQQKARKGFGKAKDESDEALAAGESRGKNRNLKDVECWNCGEKGHLKYKCQNPPKNPKDNSKSTKKDATANAAEAEAKSEDEGAWAAVEEAVDWFQEAVNTMIDDEKDIPLEITDVVEAGGVLAAVEGVVDDNSNFDDILDMYIGVIDSKVAQLSKGWFEVIVDEVAAEMDEMVGEEVSVEGETIEVLGGMPDEANTAMEPGADGEIAKLCGSGYTSDTPEHCSDDSDGTQTKTVE
jgi:hypothetical protein